MRSLTQAIGECKRGKCSTPLCTCKSKRRPHTGNARQSNTLEGVEYIRHIGERQKPRWQWAFKPSDGDITGKCATRAERKALRKRHLQERAHDGKPDKFPK